jgi:pimeloyl-ACP methyl ester carboxylesterase
MHGFEDHYVSVTGILTRYWQAGLQGSPIILLHGIGCSVLDWEQNIASLATRHRVYALDMMGSGLTEKPSREHYTIPRLGKFVLDFLSTQEIQRAHFAGFSLGGRVVLECADIAPERVASMVLVAPAGVDRVGLLLQFRLASIPFVGEMMLQPTVANLRTFFDLAFYDQSFVTPDFVARRLKQAMLPGAKEAFLKTLRSGVNLFGVHRAHVDALNAVLPTMKMPALVIWGEQDNFISAEHAEVLRGSLPNVQIRLFDNCGHLPQIECLEQFNNIALAFCDEVDASQEVLAPSTEKTRP